MKNRVQLFCNDLPLDKIPLSEYPRPQFKRDSYISLNGKWDFLVSKKEMISEDEQFNEEIIVPFSMESFLSGINRYLNKDEYIYYRREIEIPSSFNKGRILLHLDGVDQICEVYLNSFLVGKHEGGYIPFEIDISDYLKEKNILIIKAKDDLDKTYSYGKQTKKSKGMWYTKTSGIWKSVWLESVPNEYLKKVKIDVTLSSVTFDFLSCNLDKTIIIHQDNEDLIYHTKEDKIMINIDNPHLWSPEDPYLYKVTLLVKDDKVETYFALRTIEIKNKRIYLNDKPYFFHGLLDQGYYPDGLLTPKSYKIYEEEILTLKKLGFNTLRKHIKIEPLYFYYLCDRLGMIVFQDMVNNSSYSFIRDTALPTLGFIKWKNKGLFTPKRNQKYFLKEANELVSLLYNSPCVLYYTIFNEGWGQFKADKVYQTIKELDSTRIIDATSGWFMGKDSDVDSYHIYFKKIKLKAKKRPLILSEFGGYVYKINEHSFNLTNTYGYRIFKTQEEFVLKLKELYDKQVIPLIKEGLCGCIYTQVSDVEDETNGIFTYDRKVIKTPIDIMEDIRYQIEKEVNKLK